MTRMYRHQVDMSMQILETLMYNPQILTHIMYLVESSYSQVTRILRELYERKLIEIKIMNQSSETKIHHKTKSQYSITPLGKMVLDKWFAFQLAYNSLLKDLNETNKITRIKNINFPFKPQKGFFDNNFK